MTPFKYCWISGIVIFIGGIIYISLETIPLAPDLIIKALIIIPCVVWMISTGILIVEIVIRRKFSKRYGIKLHTWKIKVKKRKKRDQSNHYLLNYPYWNYSKNDGTADRRYKYNKICWQTSSLIIEDYSVASKYPCYIITLVQELRRNGIKIKRCQEETEKYAAIEAEKRIHAENTSIQSIIEYFEKNPTGFEIYCAEMFRKMGYTANVTPPSNDGGYDIELRRGCESAIIECKCYSLKHSVGRPLIQKLVGANSVVKADRMIFVTTSHFSAGAIEYATEVGVELIDSVELVKLLRQYGIIAREKLEISEAEWQLQIADLASYVPWDIYESFLQD